MKWRRNLSLPRRWQKHALINKYGNVCFICQKPIEKMGDITIDHWEPLSQGGEDTMENYRLAHEECNKLKGALDPEEFFKFQRGEIKYE